MPTYVNYNAGSVILLQDDVTYLLAVTAMVGGGDVDPSVIQFYTSTNLTSWSFLSQLETPAATVGLLIPSLYKKTNGDVFMMVLNNTTTTTNRLLKYTSTTNGASWSSETVVRENVSEYMSPASDRIYVHSTGRLIYPFNVNTNGILNSQFGNYTGYVMYSDNEGTDWITNVATITSPDDLCVENGIFKKNETTIVNYFRNRSNVIYACSSTDAGLTWGAVSSLGIAAINSQSTVIRLSNNTFIACFNPLPSRKVMQMAKSSDGSTWSNYFLLNVDNPYQFIQPTIVEKDGYVHAFYSESDFDQSTWSFRVKSVSVNY